MQSFVHAKKRVLTVSGDPRVLAEMKKGLREHFAISMAATGDAARVTLEAYRTDAVAVCLKPTEATADLSPYIGVFDYTAERGIPVLFLSERDDERCEAAAFALGAVDFALKRPGGAGALIDRLKLRIRAAELERQLYGTAVHADASPEAILFGKRLLIAEDVELNQEVMSAMLSDVEGLTLDFAGNGADAVQKVKERAGKYALVFMDIHMPEMDGLAAAKAIRQLGFDAAREIPIIALTASTEQDDIEDFLEAGMNDYLEKPMDYESFLRICAEYCRRS